MGVTGKASPQYKKESSRMNVVSQLASCSWKYPARDIAPEVSGIRGDTLSERNGGFPEGGRFKHGAACDAHQIRPRRPPSPAPPATKEWLWSQNWIPFPPFVLKVCNKSIASLHPDGGLAFHTGSGNLSFDCNATGIKLTHFPYGQVCRKSTSLFIFPGL